jgi:uncharacterized protein (TIGR02145 family)
MATTDIGVLEYSLDKMFTSGSLIADPEHFSVSSSTKAIVYIRGYNNYTFTACPSDPVDSVTIHVNGIPIPPVIDSTYQVFCDAAIISNIIVKGGNTVWYDSPTSTFQLPPDYPLEHNAIYYAATLLGACESTERSYVKVGIVPAEELFAPSLGTKTLCNGATFADVLEGENKNIAIYNVLTGGSQYNLTTTILSSGMYYAGIINGTGVNTCTSEMRTPFYINLNSSQADMPDIETPQTFCQGAQIASIKTPAGKIIWFETDTSTEPLDPETLLKSATYFAAQEKGGTCAISDRMAVVINIGGAIPPPATYGPYTICEGHTLGNVILSGYGIKWYENATGGPELPIDIEIPRGGPYTYFVEINGGDDCYSSDRAQIAVTVERCGILVDCEEIFDKEVFEDHYLALKFTQTTTDWDIDNSLGILDDMEYIINGVTYSKGLTASLLNAEFPTSAPSLVKVIGFAGEKSDTCEFTVTVYRVCPPTIPDNDGHTYTVTKLKGLCWTSNLQATTYYNDGVSIVWAKPYYSEMYPDVDPDIYGLLYTWYSAVGLPEGSTLPAPTNAAGYVQGICPEFWHIPSNDELELLDDFSAEELMSVNYWLNPPGGGTDIYHFDSRPAGWYNSSIDKFLELYGFTGYWATNTAPNAHAHVTTLNYWCEEVRHIIMKMSDGLSVRCVMDME